MKIAVDAMGGDLAPREIVRGAVQAALEFDLPVALVGRIDILAEEVRAAGAHDGRIEIVPASEVVGMDESPGVAVRKKRDSSIRVGLGLVADGRASGFVSAGNSGAVMGGALLALRKVQGIDRPAIAAPIPTPYGPIVMVDAGANVGCKPLHLFQFACMGDAYARKILGIPKPRVGLVSIGEEETKGTGLTREASVLIRRAGLDFVGNVEGRDFFSGKADVFVCDGFVGNVALKTMEGLATALGHFLRDEVRKSLPARVGALLASGAIRRMKKRLDYKEYGGAPLLGVMGGVAICHGASDARAIKNAVRVAASLHRSGVEEAIAETVARSGVIRAAEPGSD